MSTCQRVGAIAVSGWRTLLQNPTVAAALIGCFGAVVGSVLTVIFAPRVQWGIERKKELRQHRRQLIADWRAMVGDVSRGLNEIEQYTTWNTGDALRLLERHAAYASFNSTYGQYSRSGARGLWLRFRMSGVGRMLGRLRRSNYGRILLGQPRSVSTPENTLMAGSHLPYRIHLVIDQIAEIEKWWSLHE